MENNSTPIEISVEDIGLGMKSERIVIIKSANPAYDGKAIRVRTLRGREFRSITNKIHVGPEDLAGNFALALEACRVAVITPGIAKIIDDLDHDVILQVGQDIIAASEPKEEKTEDFSEAPRGS
ncbi:MAG: hypothetical protein WBN94_10715 [Methanothrix sp.]